MAFGITEILEKLKTDDPELHDVVRMVWYYFTASGKYADRDYGVLYETIKKIVEVESMPTLLEKWTAEAVAKERMKTAVAVARTETKAKAEFLLAILQEKFNRVPVETEQTILAMTDPIALQSWGIQASMSQTLDEFLEAFN